MKGWKTLLFNVISLALLATDYLMGASGLLGQVLTQPKHYALAMMGMGIVNIALRWVTTGPMVGRKL